MSHFRTRQETLSTTAQPLAPKVEGRKALQVLNTDSTLIVYLGVNSRVSSTNGFPLVAGAGYKFSTTEAVWAIASAGAPVVAILEEFER